MWWRRFPLLPQRRQGSVLWEKAEGDGPRGKQVWKPHSPSEKMASAHLIEEERCRFTTPPPSDRQVEVGKRCDTAEFCQAPGSCKQESMSNLG